jgi:hypothetical protein
MKIDADHMPLRPLLRDCCKGGVLFVLAGLCFACSPPTDQEVAYFDKRAQEREELERTTQTLQGSTRHAEAMAVVKGHAAPDAKGTIEDWVSRKASEARSHALFPRWKVVPRGRDKYEVRYEYTLMEENYDLEKKGYAWTVDLMLKIVSPHRELKDSELREGKAGRVSQISRQQRRERQKEEEFSLE